MTPTTKERDSQSPSTIPITVWMAPTEAAMLDYLAHHRYGISRHRTIQLLIRRELEGFVEK